MGEGRSTAPWQTQSFEPAAQSAQEMALAFAWENTLTQIDPEGSGGLAEAD